MRKLQAAESETFGPASQSNPSGLRQGSQRSKEKGKRPVMGGALRGEHIARTAANPYDWDPHGAKTLRGLFWLGRPLRLAEEAEPVGL
jgi:hypothetical protein